VFVFVFAFGYIYRHIILFDVVSRMCTSYHYRMQHADLNVVDANLSDKRFETYVSTKKVNLDNIIKLNPGLS